MEKTDLSKYSEEELLVELGRRKAETIGDKSSSRSPLYEAEMATEELGREVSQRGFRSWLREQERRETDAAQPCPKCGRQIPVRARKRRRTLHALHGSCSYARNYHYCDHCKHGFYPLDAIIGAPDDGQASEGLARRGLDFAVNAPYGEAAERFEMHYGRPISTHFLRCMVERLPLPTFEQDGTWDATERVTVQIDGCQLPMRNSWKEAKLGVVFAEPHHLRGAANSNARGVITEARYVATMRDVTGFASDLAKVIPLRRTREERLLGVKRPEVVFVADGAPWIWRLQKQLYPEAIGILDWVHAVQHGTSCGAILFDKDPHLSALWKTRIETLLAQGDITTLLDELEACRKSSRRQVDRKALVDLLRYYRTQRHRMNYPEHRAAGRLIGSGVAESSHRHVLQTRMKRAGMHWSVDGAEKMARLRAVYRTFGPKQFHQHATRRAA